MEINRRNFLKGAALTGGAVAFVGLAACAPSSGSSDESGNDGEGTKEWGKQSYDIVETLDYDIVVAGTGSAGIAAVARSAELGARVLCLESLSETAVGGSSALSDAVMAVNSFIQKEQGLPDTRDECYAAMMAYHKNSCNSKIVRSLIDESAANIDWLANQGVKFMGTAVGGPFSTAHTFWSEGLGATRNAILVLFENAKKNGAEFMFETPIVDLVVEDGKIAGAIAEGEEGYLRINAPAVVLCTGGYASSREVFEEYTDIDFDGITTLGLDGRNGDGILMGIHTADAALHHIEAVSFCNPALLGESEGSYVSNCGINQPINLWVNQNGERFIAENCILDWVLNASALTLQQSFSSIIDSDFVEAYKTEGPLLGVPLKVEAGVPVPDVLDYIDEKMDEEPKQCFRADTIEELAVAMGLDPESLQATVDEYNAVVEAGYDPLGKPAEYLRPIKTAPFYGFNAKLAFFNTLGGLKVDEHARVLAKDGYVPIPGLYAGGSDGGGAFGYFYDAEVAPGTMQAWCFYSGKAAAEHVIEEYLV